MAKIIRKPTTALYPLPAVLVSCGTGSRANIITLAWVGTLCSNPPLVGLGVRPSRHSHELIMDVGEFVVNLPRADQVRLVDHCGMVSGRDEDKWAACGFTPISEAIDTVRARPSLLSNTYMVSIYSSTVFRLIRHTS